MFCKRPPALLAIRSFLTAQPALFQKTTLTQFPIRQGMAEITSQVLSLQLGLLFLLPFPLACAAQAAHTLEGSRQPRCLLRLSAHTTPVGAQIRAQPEGRQSGFCKKPRTSAFLLSQLACELVTRKLQVPTNFFGNPNVIFRKT